MGNLTRYEKTPWLLLLEIEPLLSQIFTMSIKELAMETIKDLPENASWQEIEARIHLLAEVSVGYEQLERGEGTSISSESEFLNLARAEQRS
jgi:hypothetical protein